MGSGPVTVVREWIVVGEWVAQFKLARQKLYCWLVLSIVAIGGCSFKWFDMVLFGEGKKNSLKRLFREGRRKNVARAEISAISHVNMKDV